MDVHVEMPRVETDTVTFRWTQSLANPYQNECSFFFRYEELDLSVFSPELFYEIFLALQLRVFAGYAERVTVHFPTPVPAISAAYWLAFHEASNVTITPLSETGAYSPWSGSPAHLERTRQAAVYYGGGKDSTLATCLLAEIYGPAEVLLIQYVGPLRDTPRAARKLEERQERQMLAPARERLGVATQRVWTNYQAIFQREGYPLRPHLELYTVGALPALLAHGVTVSTISWSWATYSFVEGPDGKEVYHYAKSRPEILSKQSRHYAKALGIPLTVNNITLPFLALPAYRLILERYPVALGNVTMCTQAEPDQRWCYRCKKCWQYGLLALGTGVYEPGFDYDRLFTTSPCIEAIIAFAATGIEPTSTGNAEWIPAFANAKSFYMYCHVMAALDLGSLPIELSLEAIANLALMQALYGNQRYPVWEQIPRAALELLGPELGPEVERIAAEHLGISDELPGPWFAGNTPIEYRFGQGVKTSLDSVEHLVE